MDSERTLRQAQRPGEGEAGTLRQAQRPEAQRAAEELSPAEREARMAELVRRLSETEGELQALAGGQVDAILDPVRGQPILLRQAQAALRESEARYERVISHMTTVVFDVAADGTITFVNEAATAILGYTPAELIGRDFREIFGADVESSATSAATEAMRATGPARYEVGLKARDGTLRRLELDTTNRYDADGRVVGVTGLAIDRSARYRAEAKLQETLAQLETRVEQRTGELVAANAALRIEEQFSAALLDTVGALVIVFDAEGRAVRFNRACEEATGYTLADVEGLRFWDVLLLPEEAEAVKAVFAQLRAGQFPQPFENHWVARDGRRLLIAFNNSALSGPDGAVQYIIGAGIDVTAQRRAEERVRESEARMRRLTQNASSYIYEIDRDGIVRFANRADTALARNRVVGSRFVDQFSEDQRPAIQQLLEDALTSGTSQYTEYTLPAAYGGVRSYIADLTPSVGMDGAATVVWTATDVTALREAEAERERLLAELEAERTRLQAIIDNVPEAIVVADAECRIVLTNPAAEQLYARPVPFGREYDSHAELALCYPDGTPYAPRDLPLTRSALDGEAKSGVEMAIIWPDGQRRDLLVSSAPIGDGEGGNAGAVGVFQDVTALEQARRELQTRTAQLEALREVGLQLAGELDLDALLHSLVSWAAGLLGGDKGVLWLAHPDRDSLEIAVSINLDQALTGAWTRRGEAVAGTVWESGASLVIDDYRAWPEASACEGGVASVVASPILWGDEFLGVVEVVASRQGVFDAGDQDLLELLAGQAAVAIRNARLVAAQAQQREAMSNLADQLQFERDTLDTIMDNTRTCLAYLDPRFRFVKANSAYVQSCGHAREELIGQNHFALFPNEENAIIFEQVRATGEPAVFLAKPFLFPDQPERAVTYWDWALVPVKDRLGGLQGLVFSLMDVTENEQAKRDLQRRTAQLETLRGVSLRLSAELDLEALLHGVVVQAVRLFGADAGGLDIYRPERNALEFAVNVGLDPALTGTMLASGEGLPGKVWQSGSPLMVHDYAQWEGGSPPFANAGVVSALGVPVRWGDEFLGVLEVLHTSLRPFSATDAEMLGLLATQAAVAIRNARLLSQHAEQRRRAEALARATATLASSLELDPLLANLLAAAVEAIPAAERGAVFLVEEGSGGLRLRTQIGFDEFALERAHFAPGRPEMLWDVLHGESKLFPDLGGYLAERAHLSAGFEMARAALVAPLRFQGRPIGVVVITSMSEDAGFTEADLSLLSSFAEQGAVAVENSRLYAEAQGKATLEERQRLARALHDSVTQSLYSLTLFTQAALEWSEVGKHERVHGSLGRIAEVAQQSLKDMRLLVYQLRPTALEKDGLVAALTHRLNAVEKRAGVDAVIVSELTAPLPAGVEETLYYTAQEALNNALKHAAAESIRIVVRMDAGQVEMSIADDGRGFDVEAVGDKGGLGLQSMRERAERAGGSLEIVTSPGRGTLVSARLRVAHGQLAAQRPTLPGGAGRPEEEIR